MGMAGIEKSHLIGVHDRARAIRVQHEGAAARQYQQMATGTFFAATGQSLRPALHIAHADERTEMKLAVTEAQ
jgi:hypothetical protein